MRRFLMLCLLFLMVLAAILFGTGGYLLQNGNFLKARLQALVLKQTGRELAIDGPLRVELGVESTIEALGIRLQDAAWTGGSDMLSVGRLRISIDLYSLFADTLLIPALLLEDCELLFARAEDGTSNWQLQTKSADSEKEDTKPGLPILLRDSQVRNCQLRFQSPQREEPLEVTVGNFSLQLQEDDRWAATGDGRFNEASLSFSGHLAPVNALMQGGPLQFAVAAETELFSLNSSGSFADVHSGQGADLTMRFGGPDMGQVLAKLGQPILSEGAFDFRLDLDSQGDMSRLTLDGNLGSLQARAEGELDRLLQPTQGRLTGAVTGPDLEALGRILGIPGLAAEAYELKANAVFEPDLMRIRAFTLDSAGDHLSASGVLGTGPALANSDLEFSLALQQAARLGAVFGSQLPVSQPLTLQGRLRVDATGQAALQAQAEYVASILAVEGSLGRLTDPLQPDLHIDFHTTDLGPLAPLFTSMFRGQDLPAGPVAVRGRISKPDALLRLDAVEVELGDLRARLDGQLAPVKPFIGSDLAVTIQGPSARQLGRLFGYDDLPPARFRLAGGISRPEQGIRLTKVEVDLDGHRLHIDGRLDPRARLAGSELRLQLDSPNAASLVGLFGRKGLLHEPVSIEITLEPEGKGMAFNSNSSGGGIRLAMDGRIADLTQPHTIDARFDLNLPSLTLLGFLFPSTTLPDLPLAAHGQFERTGDGTRLEGVELSSGNLQAALGGSLLPDQRFDLSLEINGPDASDLQALAGIDLPGEPFGLQAQLTGTPAVFELTGIAALLGRSRAGGDLSISLGSPKRIKGHLRSQLLDLTAWTKDKSELEPAPATATAPPSAFVFDDTPVTRVIDYGLELDLDLQVAELDLGNSQLRDIELGVKLAGKKLEILPFELQGIFGGRLSGEATLEDSDDKPRLDLQLHGRNLRLGLLAAKDQDPSTFPETELHLQLVGSGATQREMASSLNGRLRLYQGPGLIGSSGAKVLFSDFLIELFRKLNPLSEKSLYTQLECAVAAADIVNGQMTVHPIVLNTRELTIFSQGEIELKTEKLDLSFNTKARKGIGLNPGELINPFIKVGGSMARPAMTLDSKNAAVSGGAAVATVGISLLAKSLADRFLSSKDPCGDARKDIEKRDQ